MVTIITERLESFCEAGLRAVGYELVDLEYRREREGWVLRVFIDHPEVSPAEPAGAGDAHRLDLAEAAGPQRSRITHSDCEIASRHLSAVLDVEDPIEGAYRLEVSSPGIRRPLRRERDFARFLGQMARLVLRDALEGRRSFTGRLCGVVDGVVELDVGGQVFRLPLHQLQKARLEVELKEGR